MFNVPMVIIVLPAVLGVLAAAARGAARVYCRRGTASHRKGDYDRAIADFDRAIRLDRKVSLTYIERGAVWHAKRD
jgi:tetratricopeptide (TPR) repeat protein